MKKGQIVEGYVDHIDFPNKGIVLFEETTAEGNKNQRTCTVKNSIPGQTISFSISKIRKGKGEGRLLEVVKPSSIEIDSQCVHYGICGGCNYQTLPYEEQLKIKGGQVKELLDEVIHRYQPSIAYSFEGIKGSPIQFAYRNKMEFSFGDEVKNGPLSLGMHKRGSFYDIVSVTDCQIVDEDYRAILGCVRHYFTEKKVGFHHRLSHVGYLRHLLVRKAQKTGEILIALITTTQETHDLSELVERLRGLENIKGTIVGILHTKNDSLADVVQSDETIVLYGKDYFYEEILGLRFKISQFSFFQTNSLGAEVLYQTARDFMGNIDDNGKKDKIIFDLYSGTGTIAQLMAPVAKKVIGVEIVEEAVEAAKKNAELNGLTNCEFIAGDVLKVIDSIAEKPDLIILDPPRDGIHPKALQKIINYGVDKIVYISCKPTSLARDLEVFLTQGYQVDRAVAVDMFPGTVHVETVVLLSQLRQKPDDYIDVDVDVAELEGTSAETKATHEKIKKYVAEHNDGMKVSSLYIAQVKRKCGIELAENFNLPKSEESRQPQCPKEKEEAIIGALKAFKMI
ncbi:MAG TPA: 23S rRNA (uracil(1939)-C(5))-methyltransferase RlmD [Lachnospiraceae bacterium]|nr:23S rRNA (uracil(1939)-C(5))-methyltransferase RlmD [Lachnospiraceae bacterium]